MICRVSTCFNHPVDGGAGFGIHSMAVCEKVWLHGGQDFYLLDLMHKLGSSPIDCADFCTPGGIISGVSV